MSPRSADPHTRDALIDAAANILAAEGSAALSSRRLASAVGTSTMAVYTHFGGMDEVHKAVRHKGFATLAADLDRHGPTGDPVADLATSGAAYVANGVRHRNLYRAMFIDRPPEEADDTDVFARLLAEVRRCIDAGRFDRAKPSLRTAWAGELWTIRHGMVTVALTGLLPAEQLEFMLDDATYRLCVGFGDDPATAKRSIAKGS
ncbi:MAG: TetR/AcrR family transcriptional regulator, partial [Sciscionella sp.]|nr:TetR/AcrR family transcriptional regulator [Sciscionella sp.]